MNLVSSGDLGLNDLDVAVALIEDLEYAINLFDGLGYISYD